jgi:hypothetical protein
VRFWQDNCFKGIQSIAAILRGLERKRCDCREQHAICPAKKSTTLLPTRGAGLVQIANVLIERLAGTSRLMLTFAE